MICKKDNDNGKIFIREYYSSKKLYPIPHKVAKDFGLTNYIYAQIVKISETENEELCVVDIQKNIFSVIKLFKNDTYKLYNFWKELGEFRRNIV